MPLNTEEKYEQKQFEREQFARPTMEQAEIAKLEEELTHAYNTNEYLRDYMDKQTKQLDQIKGAIRDVRTGKISNTKFKDYVFMAMEVKL